MRSFLSAIPAVPRRAALLLLAGAVLAGCGGPDVALNGTVVDAYTGKPIPEAVVKVGRQEATTDASGKYTLPRWATDEALEVQASGYAPASLPLSDRPELAQPTPPAVTLDTTLRPNTLSGVVKDAYTGQPVAGAVVRASDTVSTTTAADGRYVLNDVPEAFQVTVSATDYDPTDEQLSRQTALDLSLRPNAISGVVRDRVSNSPIAGATVKAGEITASTDAEGRYRLAGVPADATVEIVADGYSALTQPVEQTATIDAALRPDTLKGTLVNKTTGEPVLNAMILASPAENVPAVTSTRIISQTDGVFQLEGLPEEGVVQVLAPGYRKLVVPIGDDTLASTFELEPFVAKGAYITAAVASSPRLLDIYFDFIDRTELNTLVVDLKSDLRDDLGLVYYDSQVPLVKELGISADNMDIKAIVAEAKKRNIYLIARVQLFSHDNAIVDAKPEWGVQDKQLGEVYADYPAGRDGGIRYAYVDPTNRNVWDYNIALGVEAAQLGFDEVNFDYIRFTDWPRNDYDGFVERLGFSEPVDPRKPETMYKTILTFLEQAHNTINEAGAYVSVDVFGRVVLGPSLTISQDMQRMAAVSDYVSPMPYPSLWWGGVFDIEVPVREPYKVLYESTRVSLPFFNGNYGKLRPWLQDHTDPWSAPVVEYGPAEVRAQIDAVADVDPNIGWLLYNSANIYTEEALKPEN